MMIVLFLFGSKLQSKFLSDCIPKNYKYFAFDMKIKTIFIIIPQVKNHDTLILLDIFKSKPYKCTLPKMYLSV